MKQIWKKAVGRVVRDRSERFHPGKEVESCLQKQTRGKQRVRKCRVMLAGRASKGHARGVRERGAGGRETWAAGVETELAKTGRGHSEQKTQWDIPEELGASNAILSQRMAPQN